MKVIVPPIKSQGIKTKLVPFIKAIMPEYSGRFIEPFLGTGVVAFNLANGKATLNDINPHLIKFYKSIQDRLITSESIKKYLISEGEFLRNAPNEGYDHYIAVRSRFNDLFKSEDFLFLSRAGFNGMIRFNKKGKWNIPFCKKPDRFAQSYVTKICNQVDRVSKIITSDWVFKNVDFEKIIDEAKEGDLIYCDPPYSGRYVDYYNGWTDDDEFRLYKALKKTKAKFILSTWHHNDYRENLMVEKYWSEFNVVTTDHFYHAGGKIENRSTVTEALYFNFEKPEISESVLIESEQLELIDG